MNNTFQMIAKTLLGLEGVLANELLDLGADDITVQRRAVSFTGDLAMLYRANLSLRTATRILVPIARFRAKDADELYNKAKEIDWGAFMSVNNTFAIDATVYSDTFRHSRYLTYRLKDAIADYWHERSGKRPNVKVADPDLLINIHVSDRQITISLDSSGDSLHKRGYRTATTEAPLSEVLAAGMLLLAGWNGQCDLYDPMCGSGTLLIEAALIARNIAPGLFRQSFAFERWNDFDKDLLQSIYDDDSAERDFHHHIYGSDASFYAVEAARKNIKSAGLSKDIDVRQIRAEEIKNTPQMQPALLITNPPYGERLGQDKNIELLYQNIGTMLKHQFAGTTAWILSGNEQAMKRIGLKPAKKIKLLNGDIECSFNRYDLFSGKRKDNISKKQPS